MTAKLSILDFIYKNTEDDQKNVLKLLSISKNPKFIKLMQELSYELKKYYNISLELLKKEFVTPKHLSIIHCISSNIMIKLLATINSSSSRFAEILIFDFNDAIKEILILKDSYITMHENSSYLIDNQTIKLIDDYIDFLYNSICRLRLFL